MMAFLRHTAELLPERNDNVAIEVKSLNRSEHRNRRGRKFGRITREKWLILAAVLFLIYSAVLGIKILFLGEIQRSVMSL